MKTTFQILAFLCAFLSAAHGQDWSYKGIPYPTDNVPGAVMPTLPTGADTPGWPYDPCTIANPTFANGATQYYVNTVTGNDGTAGNSGRGSVALPRATVPGLSGENWTLTEGMQVFITGNSTLWGAQIDRNVFVNGTTANPCWIIGVGPGQPNFGGDKFFLRGQHLIMDNVRFVPSDSACRIKVGGPSGLPAMDYFTLRNSTLTGTGVAGAGENTVIGGGGNGTDNSSFAMFYRNTISNFGQWDRPDNLGTDKHGIQPFSYIDHWWIIENVIFHMEGDSVQVGSSGFHNGVYKYRPHYIYIAGNDFYENYENAIDNKNCYHVISSQNRCRYSRNPYVEPNRVGILLSNDSEGWLADYQWAIFNEIDDSGTGVKIAGNAASELSAAIPPVQITGQKSYLVGNIITNCTEGVYFDANSTSPNGTNRPAYTWTQGGFVVDNTIHVTGIGIRQNRISQGVGMLATYEISGNLIYRATAGADIDMSNNGSGINTINVLRNLGYSPAGAVPFTNRGGDAYDSKIGNLESTNPLLNSPPTDLTLASGSPAIGANAESSVYQLFEDMYGISIKNEYTGSQRPLGGTWDIGAYEFDEAYIPPTPVAPTNTSVPVISGTAIQGQTLSATTGSWSGAPTTYAYQWTRNAVDISGSTGATHLLVLGDVGALIRVRVTATNAGGSTSATSSPTAAVTGFTPPPGDGTATADSVSVSGSVNINP